MKLVMQYSTPPPNIPSLKWGRDKEDTARSQYIGVMTQSHANFEVVQCGLAIHPTYPHLGASPDGYASCNCCGDGLLEIKCPFKYRERDPRTIREKDFFLQPGRDGLLHLNQAHHHYYQIQGQMGITEKKFCDFVCWSPKGLFIERVDYDPHFFESLQPKLNKFFVEYVLPELLSRNVISLKRKAQKILNLPPPPWCIVFVNKNTET